MKSLKILIIGLILVALGVFGFIRMADKGESSQSSILKNVEQNKEGQLVAEISENMEEKEKVITELVAGGDVMLSRHVGTKIRESGDNALSFRKIGNIFKEADIAFVNLESPFYDQGDYVTEGMVFKSEPETIEGLEYSGIDIVSLANNHARNKGEAGLLYTFDYLTGNDMEFVGAGSNFEEAHQEKILENNGIKFAFLAYTYSDGVDFTSSVTQEDPDVAFMEIGQMNKDVERSSKNADVVVVSMHAGIEYKSYSNKQQQEFAKSAIDSGADLVLGHHPHVVQNTEKYNDGFIIYSMGNLVFDQMWSQETREGLIAKCEFENENLKKIEFIPVIIENYNQPRKTTSEESGTILERMGLDESVVDFDGLTEDI